ncbi:MAG: type II secretion system F family protein [Candidatus Woesearchaeota archaeon]|nr:MAG: type II secretion system F family protein [Candidatus Woesearchaeota archaeon]
MVEEVKFDWKVVGPAVLGLIISFYSFLFTSPDLQLYLIPLGLYILMTSVSVPFYIFHKKKKDIEKNFPVFLRDVAQECEAGATLPIAIRSASTGSYGLLTNEIKKMVYEISLGINVEQALRNFGDRWNIPSIKRSITSILEAERAGGNLFKTLNSIAKSVYILEDLKKERRSRSQSFVATSYVIFLILVAVLLVLLRILNSFVVAVSVEDFSTIGMGSNISITEYFRIFQYLIIIQGIFTGLAIGKTSEGSVAGGIIHTIALSSIGFFLFTIIVNMIIL